ncbi:putative receptor-like protein kinase At3g47110 isoform X1 [Quercus lobata]|uniref:putative receptor-like protein kinase At3g47110 isoform X1 n=1 Tax=Quercus lobata TaxID=97700 RepID=UPI0012458FF6|nr:putative receptor-like protein kinase At3g47110 isoform X1 [Quercus lobata]
MTLHQTNSCASCSIYLHVILFLFIILLCLQPTTAAPAPTNETDRSALLKFKESVPYDPYNILSSWNDSVNFCNWLGITCDGRHQRVTALDLPGYNLRGSLSPYIGNLSFLRSIKLQNNSFYGEIPREVGNLFRLQELRLNNNTLEGEIPSNLSKCSNLRFIHLHVNNFTGKIPMELGSLVKLEELQLLKNKLAGGIPPSLGNLSSLKSFAAEYNNLVGNIPDTIGRLKGLEVFSILMNKLSGMIPFSLYNVSSLQIFSVADNQLNGTLPINIGLNLPNLQVLQFGGNEFSGPIPTSLCNATHLQKIDLGMNNFLGSVPTNLGNLLDLFWLGLNGNYLGKSLHFLTSLKNCSKLVSVDLSKNQFQGVLPNSIANLSTNLTKLYFGVNEISGTIPASLENLVNLIGLGMDYNHFSGTIPTSFGRFQKMQLLALGGNKLSGEIPTFIGNLTQLFRLELQENRFEGTIPPTIVHCLNLQILDVSQNNLNGSIPLELIGPSSLPLILLNLSYNSLTGLLPATVGSQNKINKLDVSNNNLLGEIPISIGNFLMLEHLNLQGNSFIGAIPSSMASLKGLRYLDVSQNNLSGSIPDGFKNLPLLESLNLSFNNFEGEVPTEGVFKNTNAISLIGNAKLCGGIPNLKLPKCPVKVMKPWKSIGFRVAIIITPIVLFICLLSSFLDNRYWIKKSQRSPFMASSMARINFLYKEFYQALDPRNVTYKELYRATSGFSSSNLIGSGSFGTVYKGALDGNGTLVAIKVLNLQQKGASKSFTAECNALRNIRHRNLVKILTCCSHMDHCGNEFKALVFEFMTNGSLDVWLHPGLDNENQSRNLSLLQRLNVAIDVATAINYLHNHSVLPIIHCDLKPCNILLDNDMVAHVSDFGLARFRSTIEDSCLKETITTGLKGSIGFVAPEYGMGCDTSTKGDVYSYGIIILEMFLGKRPTDKIFKDGLNLHNYAKMAVAQPERLVQIVDPILRSIVNLRQMDAIVHKCLVPILQLGLACSVQSPKERMNMEKVTRILHSIKNAYLSSRICRGAPLTSGIQIEGRPNEENSIRDIKQIPIPRRANPDKSVWLGETSGNFSVKSSYLTEHVDRLDRKYNKVWKKLWESKLHGRLNMFLWRLAKGELPLKTRLASNSIGCEDLSCVLCGEAEESELHVFRDCIVIRMLWFASEIGLRWDHFEANSAVELVQKILNPPKELITDGLNQNKFTLMAAVICYETWTMRNLMLSKNVKFDPMEFPWRIKSAMERFSPRKENDGQCKEREKEEG